jgi:hypothetical protein
MMFSMRENNLALKIESLFLALVSARWSTEHAQLTNSETSMKQISKTGHGGKLSGIKTLKYDLQEQEDPLNADIGECLDHWYWLASFIRRRQPKRPDMDLIKLPFWLTSFGSRWIAQ